MKSTPPHLNLSLWRDLERRLGTSDLIEWIETEAERVAGLGRTPAGRIDFSRALLRDRRIESLRSKPFLPALATICYRTDGYEIAYAPYHRQSGDYRFAIAHEIAHTFWFAPGAGVEPLSPLQRTLGDDPTIEWLCNRAAAAILVPRAEVAQVARETPKVLHQIPLLAKRFLVPERLVARRMFHELSSGVDFCVIGIRVHGEAKSSERTKVVWFVPYSGCSVQTKSIQGRVIPRELLPDVPVGETKAVLIDGRWRVLLDGASIRARAKPLGNYPQMPSGEAWVARTTQAWYLAIPCHVTAK